MRSNDIGAIRLIVIVFLALAFFAAAAHGAGHPLDITGQTRRDGSSPGAVIKNFYYWYINAVEAGTDPFKKGRATLQKYVTLRLIKRIERSESEADTFL